MKTAADQLEYVGGADLKKIEFTGKLLPQRGDNVIRGEDVANLMEFALRRNSNKVIPVAYEYSNDGDSVLSFMRDTSKTSFKAGLGACEATAGLSTSQMSSVIVCQTRTVRSELTPLVTSDFNTKAEVLYRNAGIIGYSDAEVAAIDGVELSSGEKIGVRSSILDRRIVLNLFYFYQFFAGKPLYITLGKTPLIKSGTFTWTDNVDACFTWHGDVDYVRDIVNFYSTNEGGLDPFQEQDYGSMLGLYTGTNGVIGTDDNGVECIVWGNVNRWAYRLPNADTIFYEVECPHAKSLTAILDLRIKQPGTHGNKASEGKDKRVLYPVECKKGGGDTFYVTASFASTVENVMSLFALAGFELPELRYSDDGKKIICFYSKGAAFGLVLGVDFVVTEWDDDSLM